ncbi:flagellar transcriptional regulator FlhC [Paraburkholderia bryophila]|nr:flagellar transcriptional regulator FlhC [Paraburkholderia bryophila]
MEKRSLIKDAHEIFSAIALIELGARLQVLESELSLPRVRLIRLYHEVKGIAPPKGMLPYSADRYMTWRANIHASVFYNIYLYLKTETGCSHLDALTKGYRLYLDHCGEDGVSPALDMTRAWTLVRFFDAGILQLTQCCRCRGKFVAHRYDPQRNVLCCACLPPPARVGKTKTRPCPAIQEQKAAPKAVVPITRERCPDASLRLPA